MFEFDNSRRYMMPFAFGPRPGGRGSARYNDVTAMSISYLTDRDQLARYVIKPFELADEAVISVSYSMNRGVEWLAGHSYNIIAVNVPVIFKGQHETLRGGHPLVLWENLADPILTGRETEGIPKIFADIEDHSVMRGEWRTSASHYGHKIVDMRIWDLEPLTEEQVAQLNTAAEGGHWMGYKYIPATGDGPEVSHPTLFPTSGNTQTAARGKGEIQWQHLTWEQNPTQFHIVNALHDLPILEIRSAMVTTSSSDLRPANKPPRALR
jgi:acetoacetate decarboxylase